MSFLIVFLVLYILLSLALYRVFEKAGEEGWKALVPGLNFVTWCKIIGRPGWHAALLLIPIVQFFIYAGMCVDLARSFGKYSWFHSFLAVVFAPFYFGWLGLSQDSQYVEPAVPAENAYRQDLKQARKEKNERQLRKLSRSPYAKGSGREWTEAIIFAVFAAAFIRMFLFEAYMIPTPSMEGSLLVGDYLFVSKAHYGVRTPRTVAMIPLLHNRIPVIGGESYLKEPSLEPRRLPALEKIDRNDYIVFNYPAGDSVYIFPGRTWSVGDYKRGAIPPAQALQIKRGQKKLVTRPLDKMDHYIKRAVGMPGDSLQIIDRQVYIDGQAAPNPEHIQFLYTVSYPSGNLNTRKFEEWGIDGDDILQQGQGVILVFLDNDQREKIQSMGSDVKVEPIDMEKLNNGSLFPYLPGLSDDWTVDNYGPIYIPAAGESIPLTAQNVAIYRKAITTYEGHSLTGSAGNYQIDGKPADNYTFELDYYWGMGDNRHNSEDSRVWGFVPQTHIVGKPVLVFFSTKNGNIRWDRILSTESKW